MKKTCLLFFAIAGFSACNHKDASPFPKPGTIVAQDEQPIREDSLNHSVSSIKVVADPKVDSGIYDIRVNYGPDSANAQVVLPKGCEDAKPAIRRGAEPYTYIIGFRLKGDTTFHDYYQVRSNSSATFMRYIKSYSF